MARKTFISYKYSESRNLRDRIIDALGEDSSYYQGETSDSDDMSDETNQSITEVLKDMIFDTSVTIVILSPKMTESHWIDWEIEYSLKAITRGEKTSHTNGMLPGFVHLHSKKLYLMQAHQKRNQEVLWKQLLLFRVPYTVFHQDRYSTLLYYSCDLFPEDLLVQPKRNRTQ